MSDITVRALGEDEWEQYRSVRLSALEESPEAFVATARRGTRLRRGLLAHPDAPLAAPARRAGGRRPSAWPASGRPARTARRTTTRSPSCSASGSRPAARGTGVATQLVQAGADAARQQGRSHLAYWVGSDNGRAVAFASGFGFRPTDSRRPMRVKGDDDDEDEIAMVLPLGEDRGIPTSERRTHVTGSTVASRALRAVRRGGRAGRSARSR